MLCYKHATSARVSTKEADTITLHVGKITIDVRHKETIRARG
jgi:hypothetical protein